MKLRIRRMTRDSQVREGKKNNYVFFQNQWTNVSDPDDVKFFLEEDYNKDIFEVFDDNKASKKEVEEKKVEAASGVLKPYTKDEAYALSKEQQDKIIKELGQDPKNYPKEADRVKFIVENLKKE